MHNIFLLKLHLVFITIILNAKKFRKPYKYSTGKSYLTCHIRQTLLHSTINCFDPCTVSFRGALQFLRGSQPMDCFQGSRFFLSRNPFFAWKMVKRCTFQWKVFWMKCILFYYFNFCFPYENLVVHPIFCRYFIIYKRIHWVNSVSIVDYKFPFL